jgi:prolipoprotein diacylglyceryltransferase
MLNRKILWWYNHMISIYSSVEFMYIDEIDGTVLKVPLHLYNLTFDIYNLYFILFYIMLYYHSTETSNQYSYEFRYGVIRLI